MYYSYENIATILPANFKRWEPPPEQELLTQLLLKATRTAFRISFHNGGRSKFRCIAMRRLKLWFRSALAALVTNGHHLIADYLMSAGQSSCIHYRDRLKSDAAIKLFLNHGGDIDEQINRLTPLFLM